MAGAKRLACMATRKDRQKEKWERKGRKEWKGREKERGEKQKELGDKKRTSFHETWL